MRSFLQNSFSKKAASLLLGLLFTLASSSIYAKTFTLKTGTTWATATWQVVGGPNNSPITSVDDVVIPSGMTLYIPSGTSVDCFFITISGSLNNSGTLNLGGGNSIISGTLTNTGTIAYSGIIDVSTGILHLSGNQTNSFTKTGSGSLSFGPAGHLIIENPNITDVPQATAYRHVSTRTNVTLDRSLTIPGKLTIFTNKLKISNGFNFTATDLEMAAGTELEIAGTATANFTSRTFLDNSSIIRFTGANGIIPAGSYPSLKYEGTRTLAGNVDVSGSIDITGGTLDVSNYELTLKGSTSTIDRGVTTNYIKIGGATGSLVVENIGSSGRTGSVLFPIGTTTYTPATISNALPAQSFRVKVKDGVYTQGAAGTAITDKVVNKVWDVTRTTGTAAANVTLTLQWNTSDQGVGFTPSVCVISHYDGSNWETTGTTATAATPINSTTYSLTRSGIQTFSPFGVGGYLSPLPVELVSFTAAKKTGEVALAWETASEKNNAGFEVQVSNDGKNYEALSFVASRNGNSSAAQRYAYTHKTANKEGLVYYRLKQVDMNGDFEYYTAKVVDLGRIAATVNTFPNPFQNSFELNLSAPATATADILVVDMTGKTVYAAKQELTKGANTIKVELNNQPAGIYLLKAAAGNQTYTNRLVKQ